MTVTGLRDAELDGNVAFQIVTAPVTSADAGYNGLDAANVAVINAVNSLAALAYDCRMNS